MAQEVLIGLQEVIRSRKRSTADASYTRQLLDGGVARCAKKFGEEAVELVIAGLCEDDKAVCNEAADVLFHLLVLLESRDLDLADVLAVLEARKGVSGHDEKASRSTR